MAAAPVGEPVAAPDGSVAEAAASASVDGSPEVPVSAEETAKAETLIKTMAVPSKNKTVLNRPNDLTPVVDD